MGCGSSSAGKQQVKQKGGRLCPGVSVDLRKQAPDASSTDVAVIHLNPVSLKVDVFWFFHEDGFTIPSSSPHSSVDVLKNFMPGNKGREHKYDVDKEGLLEVADVCKGTNRTFLVVDVLSFTGQILMDYIFPQPWFYAHEPNVLVFCSPSVDLPKDDATHPLLFGGGHAFYPALSCLNRLATRAKSRSCKSKIVFVPRHMLCKQNNYMFNKLLPDIIEEIVELDESKMKKSIAKKNNAVRKPKKQNSRSNKGDRKVHAENVEHGISSMEDMDGMYISEFFMNDGADVNSGPTSTRGPVADINEGHTMDEEWLEEVEFDQEDNKPGRGNGGMEDAEFSFVPGDNLKGASEISGPQEPNGKRLIKSNKDRCFHLVGNGSNFGGFFSSCFDTNIVEKCYFHLDSPLNAQISTNGRPISAKKQAREVDKRENDLVKTFAKLSDLFDSDWKGDMKQEFPSRDEEDDFSAEYYESMPRNDYSLWPKGSLIVASLGENGHKIANILKSKDSKARPNNVYTRGNRVDGAFKSHRLGYSCIFLIVDIVTETEELKSFLEKDRLGLPLVIMAILPGNSDGVQAWVKVASFLCLELDETDMTIFVQAPEGALSAHAYWFLLNIVNCPTCLSTVAKHMHPFPEVHHAVAFIAMSGIGFVPLTTVTLSNDEDVDPDLSLYASWTIYRGSGGLGDGFDGKDNMNSEEGIEKAVMNFTEARTPLSPFVSATASTIELKDGYKGGDMWSLCAICPQKFVGIAVKALSAADEVWHGEEKASKIEKISRVIETYRGLTDERKEEEGMER